ncbi:DUF1236 domain-containing protein [Methylobacterium oryzisoli]|uniref:DUF1236 domain-containing protein n=1 Tax=Methylobacterium oryzisoli TaxID=3385502 RepID=UPI0038926E7A
MQRTFVAVAALILLCAAASAQSNTAGHTSSNTAVEITPEQRTIIKRHASQRHAHLVRLERMIPAGSVVPDHVEFEPLPALIVREHPHLTAYGYFLSDTGTYIVDLGSRRVITSID